MILQVGVKAFLRNKEGKYLLIKRSPVKYPEVPNPWDIVGGRIDPGSPLMENLRREVKEETGLEITSEPRLVAAQDILRLAEKHVVRLSYVADSVGKPVLDTTENTEYKWVTASEIKKQEKLDIYVKEIVEKGLVV
ncbi:MAG: NUDIX hydrolase [Candidatus Taylorbacteria bacterium]|nr:NUDIX hydrolase [Candidatus Taylorbacteria bacterium]